MKDRVQEIYNDASEYLKDNIEHQNKQIDYILINPSNDDLWVMCSVGVDTAIELHYKDGLMKNNCVPEWDYNFDNYDLNPNSAYIYVYDDGQIYNQLKINQAIGINGHIESKW